MGIADLLNTVTELRQKGLKWIDVDILENVLKNAKTTETNVAERTSLMESLSHQSRLAGYDAEQAMSRARFEAAISFGVAALKSALLINGGAAVAILAYLGNQIALGNGFLPLSLVFFTGGVLWAAIATGVSYISQMSYAESERPSAGDLTRAAAVGFVIGAYMYFAGGAYFAYLGFT